MSGAHLFSIRDFAAEKVLPPRGFARPELPEGMPVDVEIGCGSGWHPIRYALENPERFVIAIEHTRNRFAAFDQRVAKHREKGVKLDNLLPIHADAVAWVTHALGPESVERVFLLYPNPYPKTSDRGKRWHAMPFMRRLLGVLKPGGEILLATNERFYDEEAAQFMRTVWGMEALQTRSFSSLNGSASSTSPRTHFEKKYLARGQTCYERRWKKAFQQ